MRRLAVAAVVAVAAVAILIVVASLGAREDTRLAGSNRVEASSFAIEAAGGDRHCQSPEFVPRTADRVRMTIGSYDRPMPPVEVTVRTRGGGRIARAVTRPREQGVVELRLGTTTSDPAPDGEVCIRSLGSKIALAGFASRARIEWLRPGEESLWALAGTILHRFGIGKPGWMGAWTLVLAALLVVATFALTLRLVLREAA